MSDSIQKKTQICPKCWEENPAEATMCWACYTLLSDSKFGKGDASPQRPSSQPETWRGKAEMIGGYLLFGALISSGWWRGKTRFGVLGAGLAMVALIEAVNRRKQRVKKVQNGVEPIRRIADTILLYAIKDNASEVRISRLEHYISVQYQIEGAWREQVKIPLYAWDSLLNEFGDRSENSAVKISPLETQKNELTPPLSSAEQNTRFAVKLSNYPRQVELILTRL